MPSEQECLNTHSLAMGCYRDETWANHGHYVGPTFSKLTVVWLIKKEKAISLSSEVWVSIHISRSVAG